MTGRTYAEEYISPEKAAKWITHNVNNRPVNDRQVDSLAADMKAGRWIPGANMIGFDIDGRLTNGQHTLMAIIKSGCTILNLVARGLDPDVFKVTDVGKNRSAGVIAGIAGVHNSNGVMAIVTAHLLFRSGAGKYVPSHSSIQNVSVAARMEIAEKNIDKLQEAYRLSRAAWDSCNVIVPSILGGLYFSVVDRHPEAALAFVKGLGTGENLTAHDPRLVLRNRLLERKIKVAKERTELLYVFHAKAWNAFVEGRSIKVIKHSVDNTMPELI